MNKDGFYIIDNLDPGKYKAIIRTTLHVKYLQEPE